MENNNNSKQTSYISRRGVHVPKDIKEYILKRVREGGKSISDVAKEHGISKGAIHRWLQGDVGGGSNQILKLQKENQTLKQLVAELSLKVRESEKRGW